jgi:hypothetical protein
MAGIDCRQRIRTERHDQALALHALVALVNLIHARRRGSSKKAHFKRPKLLSQPRTTLVMLHPIQLYDHAK